MQRARLLHWLALLCATPGCAAFEPLRYDDDFSAQRQACLTGEPCLKAIPLTGTSLTLSLGGEGRWRYESTSNPDYGASPQDRWGAFLQRYSLFADLSGDAGWRAFLQLSSAAQVGRAIGPSPVDANRLALSNAFAEWQGRAGHGDALLTLRAGVQELRLGSGRLVDARDGPNVRRSFQGVRAIVARGPWTVSLFSAVPRLSLPGSFDDRPASGQRLGGLYATRQGSNAGIDAYALWFEDDRAIYLDRPGHESRWSLGARTYGTRDALDWNWEAVHQGGHWGPLQIRAWTLATDTGYRFESHPWRPRLSLLVAAASGDRDPRDARLETFNPLFPRGNYFGEDATLGPRNFINHQWQIEVEPRQDWTIGAATSRFLRLATEDGLYLPSGGLARAPGDSTARGVADVHSFWAEWRFRPGWQVSGVLAYLRPGRFLHETGPAEPLSYVELTLRRQF